MFEGIPAGSLETTVELIFGRNNNVGGIRRRTGEGKAFDN
jgi:hypothetical protein